MRSLRKKPDERYLSARDFRKALELVLTTHAPDAAGAASRRLARDSVMPESSGAIAAAARTSDRAMDRAVDRASDQSSDFLPGARGRPRAATAVPTEPARLSSSGSTTSNDRAPAHARRGRGVWIALAAVLAVAALGVGIYVATRGQKATATGGSGSAAEVVAQFAPYRPPGISLEAEGPVIEPGVHALAKDGAGAARLAEAALGTIADFNAHALNGGATEPFKADVLFVVAVPRAVLCAPATYAERLVDGTTNLGEPPADCGQSQAYYRSTDRTLLVVDEADQLRASLRLGISEVVSVHRPDLEKVAKAYASAVL